jgi:protocatechuate 3,4-dioxygenase beta subunit
MSAPPMTDDDRPVGRIFSRREALGIFGAGVLSLWSFAPSRATAQGSAGCIATPEQTDGPFFVDERLNRADVRSDPASGALSEGVALTLAFAVQAVSARGCAPLPGAIVDIWHCDAAGVYSDVAGTASAGRKFLRGYQTTDGNGRAQFVTIYPGWYPGRAVHIHFKVRGEAPAGRRYALSSQLYFDDALSDRVFARKPYADRGRRNVRNAGDFLYRSGGGQLTLAPVESGTGYAASFDVGLKLA